jgi:hypothetical protein
MDNDYLLTTFDNPYDPFTQNALWQLFDKDKGYNTLDYLARVIKLSPEMTQKEEDAAYDEAVDTIIANDFLNIYKRVFRQNATAQTHSGE